MDTNNWRPTPQGTKPVMDTGGWRTHSRQKIVAKIMDMFKRRLPFFGQEGLNEVKKIAGSFEEEVYTAATSQSDYLRTISLKMLEMELGFQDAAAKTLLSNGAGNSNKPPDPASMDSTAQTGPASGGDWQGEVYQKSSEGASSSSSSSCASWKYDVFVSFRGEDTRKNFTDHLCRALHLKGIYFFRDDEKLERGKSIKPELLQAIEASRFSIVVFSRNYAMSSWCLDELLKIVECRKDMGQTVYPVFYGVNPTEVRKQTGSFGKAFGDHEKAFGAEKLEKWRAALTEVANLSGWDLQDRHEAAFIQKIVEDLSTKLNHPLISIVTKGLVGIDSPLNDMIKYLDMGLSNVRIIGICGMGGIGKTTIAKVIYNTFSHQFEGSSFLANVKESHEKYGLDALVEKLLSQTLKVKDMIIVGVHGGINNSLRKKKVFLVLDDVDKLEQLKALVGDHEGFGQGSRIIITTRDEQILNAYGVDRIYKPKILITGEALQLFSLNAFKQNHPVEDFLELSKEIVRYANGLPLALVVLGSYLCSRSVNEWRSALKRLEATPKREIFDVLKISYDNLEEEDQKIFLDVSCLFNLKKRNRVIELLDACDFHAEIGLRDLNDKSLIFMGENKYQHLSIHSLLKEMAHTIVQQEEPYNRSRLWLYDDIYFVLGNKKGRQVEVIYLSSLESREMFLEADSFLEMHKLRILKIHNVKLPKGLDFLPNELRILKWHGYPLKSLPSTFKPHKLTELRMYHSDSQLLWKERVYLDRLKVIKLSHSRKLIRTLDFRDVPNLERLILEGCTSLREVHQSIGNLQRLSVLNLKDCENLRSLPRAVSGWRSLKVLLLLGCSKIDKLPENLGDCEDLEELDAGKTAITEAPLSIVNLKNLKKLSFARDKVRTLKRKRWNWLPLFLVDAGPSSVSFSLPTQMKSLSSLTQLNLSYCNLSTIPSEIGSLSALVKLKLRGNSFVSLPTSINQLSSLEELELVDCQKLQTLSALPSRLEYIRADNCSSLKLIAPSAVSGRSRSGERQLSIQNCFRLLENQGDDEELSLLKQHLAFVAKDRIREIFSLVLDKSEKQESHDQHIANFIRSWISYLRQEGFAAREAFFAGRWKLDIFLPGVLISDWFTYRTTNDSITIELPDADFTFLGVAVVAALGPRGHKQKQIKTEGWGMEEGILFKCTGCCIDIGGNFLDRDMLPLSDHLWLQFIRLGTIQRSTHFSSSVTCEFKSFDPDFDIKGCGARAVHLKDVEFVQTMFEGVNVPRLEDIIQLVQPQLVSERISRLEDMRKLFEAIKTSGSSSYGEDEDNDETRESIDPNHN